MGLEELQDLVSRLSPGVKGALHRAGLTNGGARPLTASAISRASERDPNFAANRSGRASSLSFTPSPPQTANGARRRGSSGGGPAFKRSLPPHTTIPSASPVSTSQFSVTAPTAKHNAVPPIPTAAVATATATAAPPPASPAPPVRPRTFLTDRSPRDRTGSKTPAQSDKTDDDAGTPR